MLTLLNEDCLETFRKLGDETVDCIITDPPYLNNYFTNRRKDKDHKFCSPIQNDQNARLIEAFIKESYRVLKNNTAIYCFCSSKPKELSFFTRLFEEYFNLKNVIVWYKNSWTAGDLKAQFGQMHEFIIYANKGRREFNGYRYSDVWQFPRITGKKQLHQNQKPVEMMERMLECSTNEGDLIFDPFMGSGSTAVACYNKSRNFIGSDSDKEYYDICLNRIGGITNDLRVSL